MVPLTPTQKANISTRLDFIQDELRDLGEYYAMTYDIYRQNKKSRREVERLIENIMNAVIDVAKILLAGEGSRIPSSYRDIFIKLSDLGMVDKEMATTLAENARARNILAHEYLDLNWEVVRKFLGEGHLKVKEFFDLTDKMIQK